MVSRVTLIWRHRNGTSNEAHWAWTHWPTLMFRKGWYHNIMFIQKLGRNTHHTRMWFFRFWQFWFAISEGFHLCGTFLMKIWALRVLEYDLTLLKVLTEMWNLTTWIFKKYAILSTHFHYVGSLGPRLVHGLTLIPAWMKLLTHL